MKKQKNNLFCLINNLILAVFMSCNFVLAQTEDWQMLYLDGSLLKSANQSQIYLILEHKKMPVSDEMIMVNSALKDKPIQTVEQSFLDQIKIYWSGTLYKTKIEPEVYFVNHNIKRHILNEKIFDDYGFCWCNIATIPFGGLEIYETASLARILGDTKVYRINGNKKAWISSESVFNKYGYDWNKIIEISDQEMIAYQEVPLVEISQQAVIGVAQLNVRRLPNLDEKIVDQVLKGQIFNISDAKDGWYQIVTKKGILGWIYGDQGLNLKIR